MFLHVATFSRPSGFSWTGSLKNTNIRQLYERCQRLRLTGKMQLRQGDQALELVWIGGEPIETEADQGTRSLPLWNSGEFQVDQCIPDWKGVLTKHVELTGSLRAGQIQAIYKLCSDNQLSADVELKRQSGEVAQVRFTLGKAEGATISGQAESALTALSKLSAWSDGAFRVGLRPLFGDVQAAEAPVFGEKDSKQRSVRCHREPRHRARQHRLAAQAARGGSRRSAGSDGRGLGALAARGGRRCRRCTDRGPDAGPRGCAPCPPRLPRATRPASKSLPTSPPP